MSDAPYVVLDYSMQQKGDTARLVPCDLRRELIMNKLFVGNLPYSVEEAELQELFQSAGTVKSVKIPVDRETGRKRGFGFVEMSDEEAATTAIFLLNNRALAGRQIFVSVAKARAA